MKLRKKGNALRNKKAGKEKTYTKGDYLFWGIKTKNGKKARHEKKFYEDNQNSDHYILNDGSSTSYNTPTTNKT